MEDPDDSEAVHVQVENVIEGDKEDKDGMAVARSERKVEAVKDSKKRAPQKAPHKK